MSDIELVHFDSELEVSQAGNDGHIPGTEIMRDGGGGNDRTMYVNRCKCVLYHLLNRKLRVPLQTSTYSIFLRRGPFELVDDLERYNVCLSNEERVLTAIAVITASSQLVYVWVGVTSALSLAPMFPFLAEEFHLNQQQLSLLTGLNVITLGFANIFIVPISNMFGRRMTSIVFGILLPLTCVWEALATSHKSLLAARACNGITAATSESIMVQIIADMFFLEDRGTMMGVYL